MFLFGTLCFCLVHAPQQIFRCSCNSGKFNIGTLMLSGRETRGRSRRSGDRGAVGRDRAIHLRVFASICYYLLFLKPIYKEGMLYLRVSAIICKYLLLFAILKSYIRKGCYQVRYICLPATKHVCNLLYMR